VIDGYAGGGASCSGGGAQAATTPTKTSATTSHIIAHRFISASPTEQNARMFNTPTAKLLLHRRGIRTWYSRYGKALSDKEVGCLQLLKNGFS